MSGRTIRNLDIYTPNFDYVLLEKIESLTPDQIELIPSELKFKIFKKKKASVERMNFTEKLYLLSVCFKQQVIIATCDEDTGIGIKDFKKTLDAQKGKVKNGELLNDYLVPSLFVQSDKELMKAWQYMNHVQCTDIFNLVKSAHPREESKREAKYNAYQKAFSGMVRVMVQWEATKKDTMIQFKINVPKLYALLFFYSGEKKGPEFYAITFRHAYTSNRGDLSSAIKELCFEGCLGRRGANKNASYFITSKGIELLTRVMNKLIYNY